MSSASLRASLDTICAALIAAFIMAACGGADEATEPGPAPNTSAAVTVVHGYGSTTATVSSTVEAWASLAPDGEVVSQWRGGNLTADDDEWHTSVIVPAGGVTVTAERQLVSVTFEQLAYSAPTSIAKTARLHVPAAPRGLVLILHGTGGSGGLVEGGEARYLALKAISKGYAVLAPEAEESRAGDLDGDGKERWQASLNIGNTDLRALDGLIASLIASGRLPANLPQYVAGMSNGGSMAITLGAVAAAFPSAFPQLRFKSVISYCAQGRSSSVAVTLTPTAWYLCTNDDNSEVSNTEALALSASLASRGIATTALLHPARPLYDERFTRVPGVDVTTSRALSAEFRAAGFLDANAFFVISASDITAQARATPARFPTLGRLLGSQQRAVIAQIGVMRAEHEMFSDWAGRSMRWFAQFP